MDLYFEKLSNFYHVGKPISYALMRIVSGAALMVHGYPKIQDMYANTEMVESIGFYPGEIWSPLLAIGEFGAGVLLILGFLTRLAASTAFTILAVAVYFHYIYLDQGYLGSEKAILWAVMCLYFIFHGAGKYSVDGAVGREL